MGIDLLFNKYIVCGPFPRATYLQDGYESFFIDYAVEKGGESSLRVSPGDVIGGGKCVEVETDLNGVLDLAKLFGEEFRDFWRLSYGVAYAYTEVSADEGDYVLLIGSEDYVSVYVNGVRVFDNPIARRFSEDFYAIPIRLRSGVNRFLFKVGRLAGKWLLRVRLVSVSKPIYIHVKRILAPNLVRGVKNTFYISIPIITIKRINTLRIECEESGLWDRCISEIRDLLPGEIVSVPLRIHSNKILDLAQGEIHLKLYVYVDNELVDMLEIPLKIVDENSHRIESYISLSDKSVHLFGLKPPKKGCPENGCGAIISLHGFKGHPYFSELYGDKEDLFIIGPSARDGEVNYREIGLYEVLDIIDIVTTKYRIDLDRIYLTGHSMGGYGTWYIGTRIPHIFAAIAPLSSRGDLSETIELLMGRSGWEGIARMLKLYNPAESLENLSSTPVFISHGSSDRIVPVEESRRMSELLKRLMIDHVYEEIPGAEHVWGTYTPGERYGLDCLDRESIEEFFRRHRRKIPKRVRARVNDYRFNKVWWISIYGDLSREDAYVDIEISKEALRDVDAIVIREARNVDSIEIDLDLLRRNNIISSRDILVRYGDRELLISREYIMNRGKIEVLIRDRDLCISLDEISQLCSGNKTITDIGIKNRLIKRPPVTGPFPDIFNREFAIISCGEEYCLEAAKHIQRWWFNYSNGPTRIFKDEDLYDRVINGEFKQEINLLIIGGSEKNVISDLLLRLIGIVRFEGSSKIMLGSKEFIADKIGLAMIYPSPLNPERYIGFLGGNSRESIEAITRLPLLLIPDYLVYSSELIGRDPKGILSSGFFNYYWKM
ncbi:MAG: prolyl oligopeptidase family serine peptidase [Sulfolobales archaeon]